MAKDKLRPSERRRRKGKKKADPKAPRFNRPIEWARAELDGVIDWLLRLKGSEGQRFPEGWRRGQIKHYQKRARMLRAEIRVSAAAEASAKDEGSDGPKAA